jgi:SAM-dependent methyltransferase
MTNTNLIEIDHCEVCGGPRPPSVLDLGPHPMCDDLVAVGDGRECREYPIEILYCDTCRTGHQRFQVPKRELFPTTYHYRARFTADVLNGMRGLVDSVVQRFGDIKGKQVLDIGCNDGSLLDFFRERGARTFGIEPTGACADAAQKGHVTINDFLSPEVARNFVAKYGQPDFITFTNVFAHIENLAEVFESLRTLSSASTRIVIENHYLGAVLEGRQFDTFYHEHPRTYSYTSFSHMARALGVDILHAEFPARYGGNIRVFLGKRAGEPFDDSAFLVREAHYGEQIRRMGADVDAWRAAKGARIRALVERHGPLRAKAFPGRAAILVKLLGLSTREVAAVYEKPGSLKIGNYLPGTRIPIRSDDALLAERDKSLPILNLAWHIPAEIRAYLTKAGYTGEIVDILDAGDFAKRG